MSHNPGKILGPWQVSSSSMSINNNKTNVMIIKFKNTSNPNFGYDNNNVEEINLYKYLGVDLPNKLYYNYSIDKMIINDGWITRYLIWMQSCGAMKK
jgi:hypothetical protein